MPMDRIQSEQAKVSDMMKNSTYGDQRKSTLRQAAEMLLPITALAAGAYALRKGTRWAGKEFILKNMDEWNAVRNRLHNLHGQSKGSVIHGIMERLK